MGEEILVALAADGLRHVREDIPSFFKNPEEVSSAIQVSNTLRLAELVWAEYETLLATKGMEAAYRWSAFLFSGWKKKEFQGYCKTIWKQAITQKRIFIYPKMKSLLSLLKDHSWDILIVTASPAWAIEEIAPEFGLTAENVLGMNLKMDGEHSTSQIIEPYTYGEGKVAAIKANRKEKPTLAFGDSINDLPMLCASEIGVLMDRSRDLDLTRTCKEKGLFIQFLP